MGAWKNRLEDLVTDPVRDTLFGALFGTLIGLMLGGFLLLPRADEREIRNAARALVPKVGTLTRVTVVEPPAAGGERERPYSATAEFRSALGREALEAAVETTARSKGWRETRGDGIPARGVLEYQFRDRRILARYELRAGGGIVTTRRDRSGNGFRGLVGAFLGAWLGGALFYGVGKVDADDRTRRLARWRRIGRTGGGARTDEPGRAQGRGGWARRLAGRAGYSLALHTDLGVEDCRERLRADFHNPKRRIPPETVSDRNVYGELTGDGFRVHLREGAGSRRPRYYSGTLKPEGGGTRIEGRYGYAPYSSLRID